MADDKRESIEQAIVHLRMAIQHLEDSKKTEHDPPVLRLIKKTKHRILTRT